MMNTSRLVVEQGSGCSNHMTPSPLASTPPAAIGEPRPEAAGSPADGGGAPQDRPTGGLLFKPNSRSTVCQQRRCFC